MPKRLIYGTEPFLIDKYKKEILQNIEAPEFNYLETNEFSEEVGSFLCQLPILGNVKVLIYHAETLKDCSELVEFLSKKGKKAKVYIFAKSVDKRTKLYKQFSNDEIKIFDKVRMEVLQKTIIQHIKNAGCEITEDAYQQYLRQINYYSEEINLYDVLYSLERLCTSQSITVDDVKKTVVNNESENVFSLIQLIMNQQYDEIYHQVALILQGQSNNAINVLSLLLRNYRLAYKIGTCNCSLKEIGVYGNSYVPRLSAKTCSKSMDIIDDAIRKIKRGYYQQEIALKVVLAKLCALSREG